MQNPQKPSESFQRGRNRLPAVSKGLQLQDIRDLFAQAERVRGCLWELPIAIPDKTKTFLLTCRYDVRALVPTWTLYEGEDGAVSIWSYPNNDLQMILDIACMSLDNDASSVQPAVNVSPSVLPAVPVQSARSSTAQTPPVASPFLSAGANEPQDGFGQRQSYQTAQTASVTSPVDATETPKQVEPVSLPFQDLTSKRQLGSSLGYLLVQAGLLPEPLVDSALTLQGLVREGQITAQVAVDALKRAASQGGLLDIDTLNAAEKASKNLAGELVRGAVELLQKAGLIGEYDVQLAANVRAKHGGDLGQILISAGKIDAILLGAAQDCIPLIREKSMLYEQAVIALHYCQRTRSSLDEALKELSITIV